MNGVVPFISVGVIVFYFIKELIFCFQMLPHNFHFFCFTKQAEKSPNSKNLN